LEEERGTSLRIGGPRPGWERVTVGCTVEHHEWLRRQAFDERTTIASLLRRYLSEARDRLQRLPPADPPTRTAAVRHTAVTSARSALPEERIRMTVSFTTEQFEWLRRRAFDERRSPGSLVCQYASEAMHRLKTQRPAAPPLVLRRPPGRRDRRPAAGRLGAD
jgi:hypothetical protein